MLKVLAALAVVLSIPAVHATTINFDDGTDLAEIGSFYSPQGVTFSNARWDDFVSPDEASVGAGGLKLVGNAAGGDRIFGPTSGNPIVVEFASGITDFSILGLNVGQNGARVDVYDALTGGNLLNFAEAFGVDAGVDNHPLLVTAATSTIFRAELYQPSQTSGEGMLWDIMNFTPANGNVPVPAPGTIVLFGLGLAALGFSSRRRISAA